MEAKQRTKRVAKSKAKAKTKAKTKAQATTTNNKKAKATVKASNEQTSLPDFQAGSLQRYAREAPIFLATVKVFIEIFAGCARLSAAFAEESLFHCAPIELKNGDWCDVENEKVASLILQWLSMGLIWYAHFGTPCTNHSRARTTAKTQKSWVPLEFTARCLDICKKKNIYWSIENPKGSSLWGQPCLEEFFEVGMAIEFDCCRYGATYKKPTKLMTNMACLQSLSRPCSQHPQPQHEHQHLEGTVKIWEDDKLKTYWKTTLAGRYTPQLVRAWAKAAKLVAPQESHVSVEKPAMSCHWQRWLMAESGCIAELITPPLCPLEFATGWEGAVKEWSHSASSTSNVSKQEVVVGGKTGTLVKKEKMAKRSSKYKFCSTHLKKKPARAE